MPPSLVKPARWVWNPALLEPKAKSLLRGLQVLVPLWVSADGEHQVELVTSALSSNANDFGASPTPHGMSGKLNVAGASIATSWDADTRWQWHPDDEGITVAFMGDLTNATDKTYGLMGYRTTATSGAWAMYFSQVYTLRVIYNSGGTNYKEEGPANSGKYSNTSPVFGNYNLYAWSSPTGKAGQLYRNGVKLTMASTSTALPSAASHKLVVGSYADDALATGSFQGQILLAAKWNRPLSDEEHALLAADPFVLLRRDDTIPAVVLATTTSGAITPAASAVTITPGTQTITTTVPVTLAAPTVTITPSTLAITTLASISPAASTVSVTPGSTSVTISAASQPVAPSGAMVSVTSGSAALTTTVSISLASAVVSVSTKNISTGGRDEALYKHDDALMRWIMDSEGLGSIELVGRLNEINSSDGIEMDEARRTFLGL